MRLASAKLADRSPRPFCLLLYASLSVTSIAFYFLESSPVIQLLLLLAPTLLAGFTSSPRTFLKISNWGSLFFKALGYCAAELL